MNGNQLFWVNHIKSSSKYFFKVKLEHFRNTTYVFGELCRVHHITDCSPEFENLSTLLNLVTSINDNFLEPSDFRCADSTGHEVIKH